MTNRSKPDLSSHYEITSLFVILNEESLVWSLIRCMNRLGKATLRKEMQNWSLNCQTNSQLEKSPKVKADEKRVQCVQFHRKYESEMCCVSSTDSFRAVFRSVDVFIGKSKPMFIDQGHSLWRESSNQDGIGPRRLFIGWKKICFRRGSNRGSQ